MSTYPYSQLPAEIKTRHNEFRNTSWITWVMVTPWNVRFQISTSTLEDVNKMLADGWKVIHAGE